MEQQRIALKGIIPPIVTPFTNDLQFDEDAYTRIIDHVIGGGVAGIFILGTNGECASLSNEVRLKAIRTAVKSAKDRVPVFVNVSTSSFFDSLMLCEYASAEGANYVVISPPYYFSMSQEELYRYFEILASRSNVPVFLYNAPQFTVNEIAHETVKQLASHDNIWGLKDSSGNMDYTSKLLAWRGEREFMIYVGPELLLKECLTLGADGGIHGGANVFPELYVKMYHAVLNGKTDQQDKLQQVMREVQSNIYDVPDSPLGIIIGLKYAMSLLGICSERMAMPVYSKLDEKQQMMIERYVTSLDINDL